MLSEARKTLRVDKNPGVGCVFFNVRDGGGHVGFVTGVDGFYFNTIEGNTTSEGQGYGVWEKKHDVRDTAKKFEFIHLEDLDTFENNALAIAGDIGEVFEEVIEKVTQVVKEAGPGKVLTIIGTLGVVGFAIYNIRKGKQ